MAEEIKDGMINSKLQWYYDQSRKTLDTWQFARMSARADNFYGYQLPNKAMLIDFYDEISKDGHLLSQLNQRKFRVLGENWDIVDDNGKSNLELKKKLDKIWFTDFIGYCLDAVPYGFSALELEAKADKTVKAVHLIERRNTIPEYNVARIQTYSTESAETLRGNKNLIHFDDYENIILINTKTPGLLELAGPLTIYKRYALAAWTEHGEVFAVPLLAFKANVKDAATQTRLKSEASAAARNRVVMVDKDEEVEVIPQTSADIHKIYQELIQTCDGEISKLFNHQTMTTENGGSYSQANVHKDTATKVAEYDRMWTESIVNDRLFPILIDSKMFSYPELKNHSFVWNVTQLAPVSERVAAYNAVKTENTISPDVTYKWLGIEVEPKTTALPPIDEAPTDQNDSNA
jgi:phage gp29-like protein